MSETYIERLKQALESASLFVPLDSEAHKEITAALSLASSEATPRVTLTITEIFDLAKAVNLFPHKATLKAHLDSDEDPDTEYTIYGGDDGVAILDDDDVTLRRYAHGVHLTEYPEEGTFGLGEELPPPSQKGE